MNRRRFLKLAGGAAVAGAVAVTVGTAAAPRQESELTWRLDTVPENDDDLIYAAARVDGHWFDHPLKRRERIDRSLAEMLQSEGATPVDLPSSAYHPEEFATVRRLVARRG